MSLLNRHNILYYISLYLLFNVIISVIASQSEYTPYAETEIITTDLNNGKSLKVGIISDLQLLGKPDSTEYDYTDHLLKTLTILKQHNIDTLIVAGDIGDNGTEYAFTTFMTILNKVYGSKKPILNIIMGNHDYWPTPSSPTEKQQMFERIIGQKPFSHKVINGYHFINWGSLDDTCTQCNRNVDWAQKQIESAIKDNPNKPIFVTTHLPPINTMYGSQSWGNKDVYALLKQYPQVISFSGHSHFSLIDERSIWQGEFTAITTQAIAYIELENGKQNGSVPKDEYGSTALGNRNYMGIIMTVSESLVKIERISFEANEILSVPWLIDVPINPKEFRYTNEKRQAKAVAPYFEGDNKVRLIKAEAKGKVIYQIRFKQAVHKEFVHSYRIYFGKGGDEMDDEEYYYFSDFFLMKEERKQYITLKLNDNVKGSTWSVKIYAIESWGKESTPIETTLTIPSD